MNARQAKKKAKYCYFMGIADAFIHKLGEIHQKMETGDPVEMSLIPTPIGIGHNQHGYCKFAAFGKNVYKNYHI